MDPLMPVWQLALMALASSAACSFFLGRERGAAQRGLGRPRLVGVDHGLGCHLRARPAATSPNGRGHALAGRCLGLALEPVHYLAQLGAA